MGTTESVYYKSRMSESMVYAAMWMIMLLLPFVNEFMKSGSEFGFSWCNVVRWYLGLIPFVVVFVINNYLLVPRYMLRNKMTTYIVLLAVLAILAMVFQFSTYELRMEAVFGESTPVHKAKMTFLGIPMPVVLNLSLLLLELGTNTAIIFIFRYVGERAEREALENLRLQDEIRFLKTQINPHFFMNMLNNIHAMIELDPAKAQDMTIEFSKMMRYILYEGDSASLSFAEEVGFISSYVALFRIRYPEDKVRIDLDVPDTPPADLRLPPLLLISFVENAFKHGVNYRSQSYVSINIGADDGKVLFECVNSRHGEQEHPGSGGVGLENVVRRLNLLYGDGYVLDIRTDEGSYSVKLIIPGL